MALSLGACDTVDEEFDCDNIAGTYVATDFEIVSGDLMADFDPGAIFRLRFSGDTFTSTWGAPSGSSPGTVLAPRRLWAPDSPTAYSCGRS